MVLLLSSGRSWDIILDSTCLRTFSNYLCIFGCSLLIAYWKLLLSKSWMLSYWRLFSTDILRRKRFQTSWLHIFFYILINISRLNFNRLFGRLNRLLFSRFMVPSWFNFLWRIFSFQCAWNLYFVINSCGLSRPPYSLESITALRSH